MIDGFSVWGAEPGRVEARKCARRPCYVLALSFYDRGMGVACSRIIARQL